MKLDDGRLTFVAQQEVTALDAIHKAALGKAACAGRVTEGVGTCISIHAPTWGATRKPGDGDRSGEISIHAPTWGATDNYPTGTTANQFQSTHPRGVRLILRNSHSQTCYFNPRTHVGCDVLPLLLFPERIYFNPRTHVGCDEDSAHTKAELWDFNPRTHVGCDTLPKETKTL